MFAHTSCPGGQFEVALGSTVATRAG